MIETLSKKCWLMLFSHNEKIEMIIGKETCQGVEEDTENVLHGERWPFAIEDNIENEHNESMTKIKRNCFFNVK